MYFSKLTVQWRKDNLSYSLKRLVFVFMSNVQVCRSVWALTISNTGLFSLHFTIIIIQYLQECALWRTLSCVIICRWSLQFEAVFLDFLMLHHLPSGDLLRGGMRRLFKRHKHWGLLIQLWKVLQLLWSSLDLIASWQNTSKSILLGIEQNEPIQRHSLSHEYRFSQCYGAQTVRPIFCLT